MHSGVGVTHIELQCTWIYNIMVLYILSQGIKLVKKDLKKKHSLLIKYFDVHLFDSLISSTQGRTYIYSLYTYIIHSGTYIYVIHSGTYIYICHPFGDVHIYYVIHSGTYIYVIHSGTYIYICHPFGDVHIYYVIHSGIYIYHQRAGKTNLFHMRGGRFHAGNTLCTFKRVCLLLLKICVLFTEHIFGDTDWSVKWHMGHYRGTYSNYCEGTKQSHYYPMSPLELQFNSPKGHL